MTLAHNTYGRARKFGQVFGEVAEIPNVPRGSVSGVTDSEGKLWKSYRYSLIGDITFGKPQYNNSYSYNAFINKGGETVNKVEVNSADEFLEAWNCMAHMESLKH